MYLAAPAFPPANPSVKRQKCQHQPQSEHEELKFKVAVDQVFKHEMTAPRSGLLRLAAIRAKLSARGEVRIAVHTIAGHQGCATLGAVASPKIGRRAALRAWAATGSAIGGER